MEEIIHLCLLSKRFAGNNMKLLFGQKNSGTPQKVLILYNVVAFIEININNEEYYLLQTREGGSVYGLDMSIRLKNPSYKNFIEVFLFLKKQGPDIIFRALAERVDWVNYESLPADAINY